MNIKHPTRAEAERLRDVRKIFALACGYDATAQCLFMPKQEQFRAEYIAQGMLISAAQIIGTDLQDPELLSYMTMDQQSKLNHWFGVATDGL